mgnify:CR=1 FL=1
MSRQVINPPVLTPISLSDAKSHLNVEHNEDDGDILRQIHEAVDFVERYTGLFLMTQTLRFSYDCLIGSELGIEVCGVSAVKSVQYIDASEQAISINEATVPTLYRADYVSKFFRMKPINSWPTLSTTAYNAFSVDLQVGYTSVDGVPDGIKTAIYLMVGHLYKNRESTAAVAFHEIPLGVADFLNKYRIFSL